MLCKGGKVAEEHVGVPADQARIDVVEGIDLGQALDLAEVVPVRLYLGLDLSGLSYRQALLEPGDGGDLLGMAGSDPLTEAWTREHHKPADQWTISPKLAQVLKECDDD